MATMGLIADQMDFLDLMRGDIVYCHTGRREKAGQIT